MYFQKTQAQKHFSLKPHFSCSKFCVFQREEFLGGQSGFVELFPSTRNNSCSYNLVVRVLDNQSGGSKFKTICWNNDFDVGIPILYTSVLGAQIKKEESA